MQLTPIPGSTNVLAIGYDEAEQKLVVQFRTGTYDYFDVKSEQWAELQKTQSEGKSVGSWLSGNIARKHKFRKHEEPSHGQ